MRRTIAGIISHNGRNFLRECINSCQLSNAEVLVIDNHSKDGSLDYLSSINTIHLIKNKANCGYTKAANQAIEHAINNHYDYLLLLNQDTRFDVDMIPLLMKSIEEDSLIAIVSPVQLNEQNQPEYQFQLNCNDLGIDLNTDQTATIEVPFVNAACWLMDLQKVREIGLLYPIFKNYGSDLNYCNRVIHSGYKVGINLEADIIHKKKDRDYENSFIKTIKVHNTFYLALILNPQTNIPIEQIISSLCKGVVANLLKLNFKKALLCKLTLIYLLLRMTEIRKIRKSKIGLE